MKTALLFIAGLLLMATDTRAQSQMGTISFYGDSFTFRSAWDCGGGLTETACQDLKAASSFASYVTYPYSWTPSPVFDVVAVDGFGGSTCIASGGRPGLLERLQDRNEKRIAVLIGINDVNLAGHTTAATVACIVSVWRRIADDFGADPVAVTYPPIHPTNAVWPVSGQVSSQRRMSLNDAIVQAAAQFNSSRTGLQKRVTVVSMANAYDPAPGTWTTDGVHPTPRGAELLARYFYWAFH